MNLLDFARNCRLGRSVRFLWNMEKCALRLPRRPQSRVGTAAPSLQCVTEAAAPSTSFYSADNAGTSAPTRVVKDDALQPQSHTRRKTLRSQSHTRCEDGSAISLCDERERVDTEGEVNKTKHDTESTKCEQGIPFRVRSYRTGGVACRVFGVPFLTHVCVCACVWFVRVCVCVCTACTDWNVR